MVFLASSLQDIATCVVQMCGVTSFREDICLAFLEQTVAAVAALDEKAEQSRWQDPDTGLALVPVSETIVQTLRRGWRVWIQSRLQKPCFTC